MNEFNELNTLQWCRCKLGKSIDELKDFSSFQNGVFLYQLAEKLLNKKLPQIHTPKFIIQKICIINKALEYLNSLFDVHSIDANKIANGDIEEIKKFFFLLVLFGPIEDEERQQFGLKNKARRYKDMPKSKRAVGIELGNKFCRYSIFEDENEIKTKEIESVVCFKGNQRFVGEIPKEYENDDDLIIIKSIKQILGQELNQEIQQYAKDMTCPVEKHFLNGKPVFNVPINSEIKSFSPEEIASMIFKKVKDLVCEETGENITDAVISIPSSFVQTQRQAIKDSAKIAGFEVKKLLNNSMSTAISYNIKNRQNGKRNIIVIDMGSTETDISLYELHGDICSTQGINHFLPFGAHDIDLQLADYTFDVIENEKSVNIRDNQKDRCKVIDACEKARINLIDKDSTDISVKNLSFGDFDHSITRKTLNTISEPLTSKITDKVQQLLDENNISKNDISNVLLSGKPTKMIKKIKDIETVIEPEKFIDLDLDEIVKGAVINGEALNENDSPIFIGFNARETVPVSFGIGCEVSNSDYRKNSIMIPKGSPIPYSFTKRFTTIIDRQENINFQIIQGDNEFVKDCTIIGQFMIENIQIAKTGVPQIDVTFDINEDAMLTATARDINTNSEVSISVTNQINLSEKQVDSLIEEFEKEI